MTKTIIVCLSDKEEQIAREYLKQRGAVVAPSETVDDFTVREVAGVPPNASFPDKYSQMGAKIRLVAGHWP